MVPCRLTTHAWLVRAEQTRVTLLSRRAEDRLDAGDRADQLALAPLVEMGQHLRHIPLCPGVHGRVGVGDRSG